MIAVVGRGRHFAHAFIVAMQDHRKAGKLESDHGRRQQIARDRLHYVFREAAMPTAVFVPTASGVVLEKDLRGGAVKFPGTSRACG